MNTVLPDTSIWIDFFRGSGAAAPLKQLIEDGLIVTNDLILAELIPSIEHKRERDLKQLMCAIPKVDLMIDWDRIITMQHTCLVNGLNHTGIPDLIIAHNALDHDLILFENDTHFRPMTGLFGLKLFRDIGS